MSHNEIRPISAPIGDQIARVVTVICPHCQRDVNFAASNDSNLTLVNCNVDDGGCDRDFVVRVTGDLAAVESISRVEA